MAILIMALLAGGFLAGLIQYFVDFKGLKVFEQNSDGSMPYEPETTKTDWLSTLKEFFRSHWQFFGYCTTGISGAFLVPMIGELVPLAGTPEIRACLSQHGAECPDFGYDTLVILGYAIVSGYSAVKIIRGFGAALLGKLNTALSQQQQAISATQSQLSQVKAGLDNINQIIRPLQPGQDEALRQ